MSQHLFHLLKQHKLRHTAGRETILGLFAENEVALSHSDIELALPENFDRVTIYRTLKSFVENGLIHKIADTNGGAKYAICSHDCNAGKHQHDHVHFKCQKCGDTTCIETATIPKIELPNGYQPLEVNLLVEGNCPKCK